MQPTATTSARPDLPVKADIVWWGAVGLVLLAAGPFGDVLGVRATVLAAVGGGLALAGVLLWMWVGRTHLSSRAVSFAFAVTNLVLAPVVAVLAVLQLPALTRAGHGALWVVSAVLLALGAWQLKASRGSR